MAFHFSAILSSRRFSSRHFPIRYVPNRHFSILHFSGRRFSSRHFSSRRFGTVGVHLISLFRGVFILVAMLANFSVAAAAASSADIFADLAKILPTFSWEAPQSTSLAGIGMRYRQFTSALSIDMTAKRLADRTSLFEHVIVLRGKMVLSGTRDGRHWVVELDAYGRGTRGLVSTLPMTDSRAKTDARAKNRLKLHGAARRWVPASAVLKFQHSTGDRGREVVQRLYRVGLPVSQVLAHVAGQLAQAGWVRAARDSTPGIGQWGRKGERLLLACLPVPGGSALFMQFVY